MIAVPILFLLGVVALLAVGIRPRLAASSDESAAESAAIAAILLYVLVFIWISSRSLAPGWVAYLILAFGGYMAYRSQVATKRARTELQQQRVS